MERLLSESREATLADGSAPRTAYEEPQGEAEVAIASVWRQVFGLERIGRNDNFFELGGNSVVGMRLVEALGQRVGLEIPVVTLFLNPTIREVALLTQPPNGA